MRFRSLNVLARVVPDEEARAEICRTIEENAQLDLRFVLMNGLAGVVATYGLLADSTATVIGAMVIATLIGAISGIALALVHRDTRLLRQSLLAAAAGVAIVLVISFVVGWVHQWMPLSGEVLARTHPNILDLAIAVAGGAAGAYAMVSTRVSAGLVGVAIATALVPPIAVCGICLSRGELGLALGAFELFVTNFAAIQITSSVMMWLFGFRKWATLSALELLRNNRVSITVLLVLATVLTFNLVQTVGKHRMEAAIREHVTRSVEAVAEAELMRLTFEYHQRDAVQVTAIVVTPIQFENDVVSSIKAGLPYLHSRKIDLKMLSILSTNVTDLPAE